jgi:hypothetical protein
MTPAPTLPPARAARTRPAAQPGAEAARALLLALLEALLRALLAPPRAGMHTAATRAAPLRASFAQATLLWTLLPLLRRAGLAPTDEDDTADHALLRVLPPRGLRRGSRDIIIALAHAGPRRTRPKTLPRPARPPHRVHDPPPSQKSRTLPARRRTF